MPTKNIAWAVATGFFRSAPESHTPQQHHTAPSGAGPSADVLGQIHFPVSCTPDAQAAFDQAMKLQHSFWYEAAGEAFRRVRERDPTCVMAYVIEVLRLDSHCSLRVHADERA